MANHIEISKTYSWPMGHRLSQHHGLCRNFHGHTYRLDLWVLRPSGLHRDGPEHGMVIDFDFLSTLIRRECIDHVDHAFVYWEEDKLATEMAQIAGLEGGLKFISLPFPPTVEHLVQWIGQKIMDALKNAHPDLQLSRLILWESETSCAAWSP